MGNICGKQERDDSVENSRIVGGTAPPARSKARKSAFVGQGHTVGGSGGDQSSSTVGGGGSSEQQQRAPGDNVRDALEKREAERKRKEAQQRQQRKSQAHARALSGKDAVEAERRAKEIAANDRDVAARIS